MNISRYYKTIAYRAVSNFSIPDDYGNPTDRNEDSAINGYIEPLSGGERIQSGKQEIYSTHRLFTDTAVSANGKIFDNDCVYNINYVAAYKGHYEAELSIES